MAENVFTAYLRDINRAVAKGDATEHTHRPALKGLIEALGKNITATNEPKRVAWGAPDFVVSRRIRRAEHAFGHIECKDIGVNLKKEEKSAQLKRYLGNQDNLILTDYINFRLYVGGELQETGVLAKEGKGGAYVIATDGESQLKKVLAMFFAAEPIRISSAKVLAEKMAGMAQWVRDVVQKIFAQEGERGSLHELYDAFREVLIHEMTDEQFADMYAQMIVYGLFSARCFLNDETVWGKDTDAVFVGVDGKRGEFTRANAARLVPKTNPFLRKVFGHLELELDDRVAWLVDDVVCLLREAQMDKILRDFARETKRSDPVVHFYETFLSKYDPKLREKRGVYYTPEPVVSYIVRSVDWLLKEKFGLNRGLADHSKLKVRVTKDGDFAGIVGRSAIDPTGKGETVKEVHRCLILDPAVGTGTFLFEVIREVYKRFSRNKGAWPGYVREHLLPRLFGFELMMAPYAICHMKLGLELRTMGYAFDGDERVGVYLTNTLEAAEEVTRTVWTQAISEEARAANRVKRELPIMVVLGNPPYSYESSNKGEWISKLVRDYYFVSGKPLGERNPKGLQDDYVKFIRYGQYRIEQTGAGILAFITNHGYLDNATFRGMREKLMETFSEIYVLDLHGNSKKKEVCPDGLENKNVFDIQQGVSIGIFVKGAETDGKCKVYHCDLWGARREKYEWLKENDLTTHMWEEIEPKEEYYFFVPTQDEMEAEYKDHMPLNALFLKNSSCMNTARDGFVVDMDSTVLSDRFDFLMNPQNGADVVQEQFGLKDTSSWTVSDALGRIRDRETQTPVIIETIHKPFDFRYLLYEKSLIDRPRAEVNLYMQGNNIAVVTSRQTKEDFAALATRRICSQHKIVTVYDRSYFFPLYQYPGKGLFIDTGGEWEAGKNGRIPNLDKGFIDAFSERVGLGFVSDGRGDLKKTFGPEDLFDYIYGVFHCPAYRRRYAEFLKIDFPRVPLPRDCELFRSVARLGGELAGFHLMESDVLDEEGRGPEFNVEGDMTVAKGYPKYDVGDGRVYINEKQYFAGVGEPIWNFHVGGYQVCEKWLKDRRGRVLSYDDVSHYQRIVVALGETIRVMSEIDEAIDGLGGWPIDSIIK